MVRARVSFNVGRDFNRRFQDFSKEIVENLQKEFRDIRKEVGEAIDDAVTEHADLFIPTDEQAGELGVGANGSVDTEKTQNAWKQLLTRRRRETTAATTPTLFSVRKLRSKTGIGSIAITIDEDRLYRAPLSIVQTESSILEADDFSEEIIPWLKWFIRGKSISGVQFTKETKKKTNLDVSRTGKGIMIQGGFWDFIPGTDPFPLIEGAIVELATEIVESFIERVAPNV